jgi:hypothetical protein
MMRKLLLAAAALIAASGAFLQANLEPDELLAHVRFLASDELAGRGNGTDGLERAADYVAREFKAAGLKPGTADGDWFQRFELIVGLKVGPENTLVVEHKGRRVSLTLGETYYPLAAVPNENLELASEKLDDVPLVFAGYGLSAPNARYDDYAQLDVKGKAVVIFSHEPQERDADSRLNGTRAMPQTTLRAKAAAARSRGARALLVIGDPTHQSDEANYKFFNVEAEAEEHGIPVLRISREAMQPLIDAWGIDGLARLIDRDLQPRSAELPGASVRYVEHLARNRRVVRNVIGVVPGSDPQRAQEAVVIGAHYDHVGLGGRLSSTPELTGEIHNGADDNASGTAALIELAEAVAQQRDRFPRTVVFIAFAGEERGLLGSAHYVSNPVVPIADTVAMLNLDMIGRPRGGVDVSGLDSSPSVEQDVRAAVKAAGVDLEIRKQGPGPGRSDDSSFLARRVPAFHFFTGFHADYHRPSDDWEKFDAAGTRRVASIVLELAARLAARPERPEFIQPRR